MGVGLTATREMAKEMTDLEALPPSVVVGSTPLMRHVWRLVALAARSTSSVVIVGETGVGKEVIARALHRFSTRRARPFVPVNCAALPATLVESELFGHEKGSFTGAVSQHKGRFEVAHGGTLFLDEIGDLPLEVQVKLLRVLQEHAFERVGGTTTIPVDVRIVAATHRRIEEEVLRGRFRADLFYRLNVLSIEVPPLRERKADILSLWKHFVEEAATREGRPSTPSSHAVERALLRHDWPGNIRELENAAAHAVAVSTGERILPADLPSHLCRESTTGAHDQGRGLVGLTLREIERRAILETWRAVGNVKAAAEMLGISERKVHYRIKEYRDDDAFSAFEAREELSVASRPTPEAAESEPAREERAHPPRLRVLLAEDDDELRWALTDFLRADGYEVIAVPSGAAVLTHLGAAFLLEQRDAPPDLIVSDVRMPGISGLHILQSVRARAWNVPVVLITAFGDGETREQAQSLGAAALLEKPLDLTRLREVLHGVAPMAQRAVVA
jgi:DNA-binding NtrC family response regulator